jgi:hypothetical protein
MNRRTLIAWWPILFLIAIAIILWLFSEMIPHTVGPSAVSPGHQHTDTLAVSDWPKPARRLRPKLLLPTRDGEDRLSLTDAPGNAA